MAESSAVTIDGLELEISTKSGNAVNEIGKITNALTKLETALNGKFKFSEITQQLKSFDDQLGNMKNLSVIRDLATGIKALGKMSSSKISSISISQTSGTVQQNAEQPISAVSQQQIEMGEQYANTLSNLNSELQANSAIQGETTETGEQYTNTLINLNSELKNTKPASDKAKTAIKGFGSAIKSTLSPLTKFISALKRIAYYRFIRSIIKGITTSVKEGISNLYQYSKAVDGAFSKAMDKISTSSNYLKNSFGAMLSPIIISLAPIIEKVTDKIVDYLNVINQIIARLSGQKEWTKAVKVQNEYAKATKDSTKANKELKKSLLGFDELNVLNDTTSASSADAGATDLTNAYEFKTMPLDTAYADGLIDKLKEILWYVGAIGAGLLAWKIGKGIASLVPKLSENALAFAVGLTLTVTGLTIMVKGMVDIVSNGINWKNFAETLLGGGGVIAGGTLLGKSFGNAILGASISSIIVGIPLYITGIWDAIKEGLNWLNALIIPAGSTLAGAGIGAIIGSLGGPIGAGIGALVGLIIGAITDLVILIVQNWDEIVGWLKQAISDIGKYFSDKWNKTIASFKIDSVWWYANVISPIQKFFQNILDTVVNGISKAWNSIVEFFSPAIEWFSNLFGSIYETISDVFYDIGVVASGCWEIIKKVWENVSSWWKTNVTDPINNFSLDLWNKVKNFGIEAWNSIKSVFSKVSSWWNSNIYQPVNNFNANLWKGFLEKAKSAWEGVKSVFSKVADFFGSVFSKAWERVVKVFSIAGDIFNDIKDGIVNSFKTIVNGLIKGINSVVAVPFNAINSALSSVRNVNIMGIQPFSGLRTINVPQIPLLAGGGFVNRGDMFIANERGAELVGQIGGNTAVANNGQIIEGISEGVKSANGEVVTVLYAIAQQIIESIENNDKSITLDGKEISRNVTNNQNKTNRMYGRAVQNV
ncbi:MAG: hypothetical protein KBS62_03130 [Oscillospiraceae bacterium]|nr:hypothetical protein [Candidatus Ruminococcus equi]